MASSLSYASSSRSCEYDVFLSFRGEDTRKTFVDHLYSAFNRHLIRVYKDNETLLRGESIKESLLEAIEESRIAIIIFSKNYADSSWCLDELAHIIKCKNNGDLSVIPIFYDVEPTEVRNQKRKFGEAFAKQEAKNISKAEIWRQALVDVSNIAGWELKNVGNGHESQFIKKIVDTVLDRLFALNSCVDEDIVGMRVRFQDLESLLDVDSSSVCMAGIWGVGGGGKTTLATSVYMSISQHFQGHCIVENVREETTKHGLNKLQENILSALFKKEVKVYSVAEGKRMMKSMLCRRKVLVLLDDVDKLDQLEALAGKRNWFGNGSKIIITTRDEHLLKTHKVDHIYPVSLLSHDEAIWLFKRHAYNEEDPVEDYETLSLYVVSYCAGLPLAIKVLGSFLYDKSMIEWMSAIDKLKEIPDPKVINILKISFNGLETYQKELFLDIACFWRFYKQDIAMEVLEACGHHPKIGIKVLMQKALIRIVDDMFDMHDLVQEMGYYIVRGEHPNNPEKHSRLWNHKEINNMPFYDDKLEYDKIEAMIYDDSRSTNSVSRDYDELSRLFKIVANMKKLRLLIMSPDIDNDENAEGVTFLSNELRYIEWFHYPTSAFPQSFQPMKLVVLKLFESMQKEVWKGYKHLPCLRVFELSVLKELLSTPNFDGLPRLENLTLDDCEELEDIHPSLGNHTSLQYLHVSGCKKLKRIPITRLMNNIKTLLIMSCSLEDGIVPSDIGELSSLQELNLSGNDFSRLDFSLSQLTRLKCLDLSNCDQLLELPELPSSLIVLKAHNCKSLIIVEDFNKYCFQLCHVSLDKYGWSDGLLQSMLKGNAIENGCVCLLLECLDIPKGFTPLLLGESSCRLELPMNWCDDFSGFLMCIVNSKSFLKLSPRIIMKQVSDMDFKDDVVWEESDGDNCITWMWYVSFGSLRHTTWWDQSYKSILFNIQQPRGFKCIGFRVRLIEKKSTSGGLTETSTISSSPYTPKIVIAHDSSFELKADLDPYKNNWYI